MGVSMIDRVKAHVKKLFTDASSQREQLDSAMRQSKNATMRLQDEVKNLETTVIRYKHQMNGTK